jgi:hypothetical protein
VPHLKDAPRRAAMDLQRLVQRPVKRGAMVTELLPQLLLLLSVSEGGRTVDAPPLEAERPAREEEASAPCPRPPATMWPAHRLTSAPSSWGSGDDVGKLAH